MIELAGHGDRRPLLLKDIAANQSLSEKYLSKIVLPLKKAGYVNAYRGANGGFELARPAEEINVRSLVEILEGDIHVIRCASDPSACSRTEECITREVWAEVEKTIFAALEKFTLADLINPDCKLFS